MAWVIVGLAAGWCFSKLQEEFRCFPANERKAITAREQKRELEKKRKQEEEHNKLKRAYILQLETEMTALREELFEIAERKQDLAKLCLAYACAGSVAAVLLPAMFKNGFALLGVLISVMICITQYKTTFASLDSQAKIKFQHVKRIERLLKDCTDPSKQLLIDQSLLGGLNGPRTHTLTNGAPRFAITEY